MTIVYSWTCTYFFFTCKRQHGSIPILLAEKLMRVNLPSSDPMLGLNPTSMVGTLNTMTRDPFMHHSKNLGNQIPWSCIHLVHDWMHQNLNEGLNIFCYQAKEWQLLTVESAHVLFSQHWAKHKIRNPDTTCIGWLTKFCTQMKYYGSHNTGKKLQWLLYKNLFKLYTLCFSNTTLSCIHYSLFSTFSFFVN